MNKREYIYNLSTQEKIDLAKETTDLDYLKQLGSFDYFPLQRAVCANPATTPEILKWIIKISPGLMGLAGFQSPASNLETEFAFLDNSTTQGLNNFFSNPQLEKYRKPAHYEFVINKFKNEGALYKTIFSGADIPEKYKSVISNNVNNFNRLLTKAKRKNISKKTIAELIELESKEINLALIENPSVPYSIASDLYDYNFTKDEENRVVLAYIKKQDIPYEQLENYAVLYNDNVEILNELFQHLNNTKKIIPKISTDVLIRLVKISTNSDFLENVYNYNENNTYSFSYKILEALIKNDFTPINTLRKMLTDEFIIYEIRHTGRIPEEEIKEALINVFHEENLKKLEVENHSIPKIDYRNLNKKNIKPYYNQDLELLKRLKSSLK